MVKLFIKFWKKPKIGLALSGGAARGLAHIGVLKALEEMNIKIDFIAGTSMGALIGALYASGLSAKEIEKLALEIGFKKMLRLFISIPSSTGLISGKNIENYLISIIGDIDFSKLKIPFLAVATDIETGKVVKLNKGSVIKAIRASIAIPGIFSPIEWNNHLLVDGGVTTPLPIGLVKEMGANKVIAVNVIPRSLKIEHSTQEWSLINIIMQSLLILENVLIEIEIKKQKPDYLIEPDVASIGVFDFHRGKEAIEIGYEAAKAVFKK
ncbi:MAG: patatin-like phospholipase family protein [Candidatus Desulfofervidus auxilii]|nr:patatin-like phospholipase family protein [Candidatus Desulfofervidus auxilii]